MNKIFFFLIIGFVLTISIVSACFVPAIDDNYIENSTTLCADSYHLVDAENSSAGVFILVGNNIVFDCNNSIINGDQSYLAISTMGDFQNITIKNCNILNYSRGIELDSYDSNILSNEISYINDYSAGLTFGEAILVTAPDAFIDDLYVHDSNRGIDLKNEINNIKINNSLFENQGQYGLNTNSVYDIEITNSRFSQMPTAINLNYTTSPVLNNLTISFTDNEAIHIYGTYASIIKNSNISNVSVGILIESRSGTNSSNNEIYNNYFSNNLMYVNITDQVLNNFNTSKTSGPNIIGGSFIGGNYYDDYAGVDSDGDGIGDVPYLIGNGVYDYLPLTNVQGNSGDSCFTPEEDDNYINTSTILCEGHYYFNDSNDNGVFILNSSNFVFDCNNSIIDHMSDTNKNTAVIQIVEGNNITLKNCEIQNQWVGINIKDSESVTLENLNVHDNYIFYSFMGLYTGAGLSLNNVSNSLIKNSIFSNNGAGIKLYDNASNNTFSNNSIIGNHGDGLYLTNAENNIFKLNNISNSSKTGLFIDSSDLVNNNLFYNNYFSNNQLVNINITNSSTNFFNTSKTTGPNIIGGSFIGGNYYDDYEGFDSDGDGIGETNYSLGNNLYDFLPLTNVEPTIEKTMNLSFVNKTTFYEGNLVEYNLSFENFTGEVNLTINFKDGNIISYNNITSPFNFSHVFANDGNYNINTTLVDSSGNESDNLTTIVLNSKPEIISTSYERNPTTNFSFKIEFSDNGTYDSHSIIVFWGDGQNTTSKYYDSLEDIFHNYSTDGNYTINFTIEDSDGAKSDDYLFNISVNDDEFKLIESKTVKINNNFTIESFIKYIDSSNINISWGDGSSTYDANESNDKNYTHIYDSFGTFEVNATLVGCRLGDVCEVPRNYISKINITVVGCGDGLIQEGEECDGSNLNDLSCSEFGFNAGSLSCSETCEIISSECYTQSSGGGGGSYIPPTNENKTINETLINESCEENWTCDEEWSGCVFDNLWVRNCSDSNQCGTSDFKPNLTKECNINFKEALTMTRNQIASLMESDLSEDSLRKLQESDSLLAQVQIDIQYGYLGNTLLKLFRAFHTIYSIPEFELMSNNIYRLSRLSSDLVLEENLNSDLSAYNKEKIHSRLVVLKSELRSSSPDEFLLLLTEIYNDIFILDEKFMISTDDGVLALSNKINGEWVIYTSYENISASEAIGSVKSDFNNYVLWKIEDLVDLGQLSNTDTENLQLDLQRIKQDLQTIQEEDLVWTKTWEFGIDNIINYLFLNESLCGNGILDVGELCDDGNNIEDDGCTSKCVIGPIQHCGDGIVDVDEECDLGVLNSDTGFSNCTTNCTFFNSSLNMTNNTLHDALQELMLNLNGTYFSWSRQNLTGSLQEFFNRLKKQTEEKTLLKKLLSDFFEKLLKNKDLLNMSTNYSCEENWNCTSWSVCTGDENDLGKQIRICTDKNGCGTNLNKPVLEMSCNFSNSTLSNSTYFEGFLNKAFGGSSQDFSFEGFLVDAFGGSSQDFSFKSFLEGAFERKELIN